VDRLELNAPPQCPLRVGLTGGIGSGKSTVAAELQRCGAVLVDTDAIARSMAAAGGAAIPALAAAFGADAIAADGALPVVFDVPLLTESSHWRARVHRILVVDCSTETQVRRVALRPGWTDATARAVVAQQATRERRRAIADAVIHNEDITLAELGAQVRALWSLWNNAAHQPVSF
jgi:dephospho-CoA kinase